MKTYEQFMADEAVMKQLKDKMFQLAKDLGCFVVEWRDEVSFLEWQDALNFQELAREQGLELHLINADPKPVTFDGKYYRLFPKRPMSVAS